MIGAESSGYPANCTRSFAAAATETMPVAPAGSGTCRKSVGSRAIRSEPAQCHPKRNSRRGDARLRSAGDTLDALATMIVSLNASAAKATVPGDAAAGKQFFFGKGQCASCHMVHGEGSPIGPDLSDIALDMTVDEIRDALLEARHADRSRLWPGLCAPAQRANAARIRAKPHQFRPGLTGSDRRVSSAVAR